MTMPTLGGEATATITQDQREQARAQATYKGLQQAGVVTAPKNEVVTVQSQQPLMIALLRGAIIALIAAGVNLFTALQLDFSVRDSLVSAALVFFTVLQARGFAEGVWDNWRAERL